MKCLTLTLILLFSLNVITEILAQDYFYYYKNEKIHLSEADGKHAIRFQNTATDIDKEALFASSGLRRLGTLDGVGGYTLVQDIEGRPSGI